MNLWVKNTGLLFVVALFLFSCDDPDEFADLGNSINPNGGKVGVYFTEIPISSTTVLLDSVNSKNTGSFLVGKHRDPDFGHSSASTFSRILPSVSNPKVPEDMIVDSVVLILRRNYFYGSDFSVPQTIKIHGLTEDVNYLTPENTAKQYFTFDKAAYSPQEFGSRIFSTNPDTDSLLRIPLQLNDLVLNQWLVAARNYRLDSAGLLNFFEAVKGIALIPDEDNSVIMGFNSRHADSKISVFYHNSADTSTVDFKFYIADSQGANFATNFINIETDRTGTPLAGITPRTDFYTNNNTAYIQAGAGIATKLNIEGLKNFLDTTGNILINRVDLEVGAVNPFSKFYEPPGSLLFYYTDETNRPKQIDRNYFYSHSNTDLLLKDIQRAANVPPVFFQPPIANETYRDEISNFSFAYADGQVDVMELLAQPSGLAASLRRATIPTDKLKLKIYYTKLN